MTILFLVNAIMLIYTAYTKLPKLESLLPNCSLIQDSRNMTKSTGFIGRLIRQAVIWDAIRNREKYHDQGLVDKHEISRLPKGLWLWLDISQRACGYIVLAMIPSYIFIKMFGH
jgi:hypothetical protein